MLLVLKNKLKGLTQKEHYFLKSMCRKSKDVYNSTLYQMRQHFFKCGERLTYATTYHKVKKHHSYQSMPALTAQQSMKMVDRAYASFFGLLKSKKAGHYVGEVRLPRYLHKEGYFPFIVPNNCQRWKNEVKVRVPVLLQRKYKLKEFKHPIPECIRQHKLKEIRIIPKLDATYFEIEYVYEVEEPEASKGKNCLSIDIGVSNFATCLDEKSGRSFILDGRELKSLNRLYNKTKGELQLILAKQGKYSSSHRIRLLGARRGRQINEYLNQYVNFIIQYCLANDVGKVIIGEGWLAQNGANRGEKNNQNFVNLPFAKFAQKLKSKLALYGIDFKAREESYTSKCDHLAGESMCHHETYLGNRKKRGLFVSSTGVKLNADVNGALGIMLKEGRGKSLITQLSSGCVTQPRRIRIGEIRQTSSKRLIKTMFN